MHHILLLLLELIVAKTVLYPNNVVFTQDPLYSLESDSIPLYTSPSTVSLKQVCLAMMA